jgi:cytochrome c oxidase subunit 2
LEITVAIIEAVILIAFSIPIWAKRVNAFPPEKDSVVVKVVAQQFSWNFHYAGPDGKFGNTQPQYVNDQSNPVGLDSNDPHAMDDITTRVMVLPVQKPAIVHLTSKDVIHSFGVPLLRVKHDMIPGMSIPLWFIPKETGQFEIVCSQLCGVGHARMKGVIQVKTQEEFDTWLSQQSPTLSASEDEAW